MEQILERFAASAPYILSPTGVLLVVSGVAFGILAGAIPGIGSALMMTMILPFTFSMHPALGLSLLAAVWTGSQYGSSIPAILINTPAAASSVPTTLDGYALHLQGKSGKALGISLITGFIGGLASVIVLMIVVIPLGEWALVFGPPEYFAVALFGLAAVSSLVEGSTLKALISAVFGLALSTIGLDLFTGSHRMTLGISRLADGIPLVPVIMGLFALSEVAIQAEQLLQHDHVRGSSRLDLPTWGELRSLWKATAISTLIGIVVGVMPGAGSSVASFVAYNEARRISKNPELFGKGSLEGVAAPETANNAVVAGDLAPMLALAIPGSLPCTVMMSALLVNGVWPGPMLFSRSPEIVYGLFLALILANFAMVGLGFLIQPIAIRMVNVRQPYLLAGIVTIVVTGAYTYDNSLVDVFVALIFGVIGYGMRKTGFSLAAAMLALVLGSIVEVSLRRGLALYDGDFTVFLTRPISLTLIVLALVTFVVPLMQLRHARSEVD